MFTRLEARNPRNPVARWLATKENARRDTAEWELAEWQIFASIDAQLVACFPRSWRAFQVTALHAVLLTALLLSPLAAGVVSSPAELTAVVAWLPAPAVTLLGIQRHLTTSVPSPDPW